MCSTIRVARMQKCASKGTFSPKSKLLEHVETESNTKTDVTELFVYFDLYICALHFRCAIIIIYA
jgi:hypothetical protein